MLEILIDVVLANSSPNEEAFRTDPHALGRALGEQCPFSMSDRGEKEK